MKDCMGKEITSNKSGRALRVLFPCIEAAHFPTFFPNTRTSLNVTPRLLHGIVEEVDDEKVNVNVRGDDGWVRVLPWKDVMVLGEIS